MTRRRLALAAALGLAGVLIVPIAASADDAESASTRWSVTPATESGSDDRLSIQHALEAGETMTDRIAVQNLGEQTATFSLSAADGFTTRSGRFDMLASDEESVDSGTWIEIADEVTVEPGESVIVPFTITVPDLAEPGDHPAGVAASVVTTQSSGDGTNLGVESRVGVKVITRVKGELEPALEISNVSAEYHGTWNPLRPGQVTATFELANVGNTRISAEGNVTAGTGEAGFPGESDQIGELLPGDTRQATVTIDGTWPTFFAPGELVVTPTAAALDGTAPEADKVAVDLGVWAMPWPQLLVIVALALIIIALTWNRRRGRRRMDAMLQQARDEGKREAAGSHGTTPRISAPHGLPAIAFALIAFAAVGLAPDAAIASDYRSDDVSGVGVHVHIDELDDGGPSSVANGDADADGPAEALSATGTDPSLLIALAAAGAVACGAGVLYARRRSSPRDPEALP